MAKYNIQIVYVDIDIRPIYFESLAYFEPLAICSYWHMDNMWTLTYYLWNLHNLFYFFLYMSFFNLVCIWWVLVTSYFEHWINFFLYIISKVFAILVSWTCYDMFFFLIFCKCCLLILFVRNGYVYEILDLWIYDIYCW